MTNAYCDLEDVKSRMSGDLPNMGSRHDQTLASKILEVSRDIDRKVALCRGEPDSLWSFVADRLYGRQVVTVSSTPPATGGTFKLSFAGQTTNPITYDAPADFVRDALLALDAVGADGVTVSGPPGGPWTVELGGGLSGPQPAILGYSVDLVPGTATVTVLVAIVGTSVVPSPRLFTAEPDLYGRMLRIDDCVEIESVRSLNPDGTVFVEYGPSDYKVYPSRGLPIEGLKFTLGTEANIWAALTTWPEWPVQLEVVARWGYAIERPVDVREATAIEVIRSHLGDVAGNDDRLGMTPFGSVTTAKAFTSKLKELTADYGHKLWP